VLWESLANQRLFRAPTEMETMRRVAMKEAPPVSSVAPWAGAAFDAVVARALEKAPERRFPTARALAEALDAAARRADHVASPGEVGDHVRAVVAEELGTRRAAMRGRAAPDRGAAAEVTGTPITGREKPETTTVPARPGRPDGGLAREASSPLAGPDAGEDSRTAPLPAEPPTRPVPLVSRAAVALEPAPMPAALAEEMSLSTLGGSGVAAPIARARPPQVEADPAPAPRPGRRLLRVGLAAGAGLAAAALLAARLVSAPAPAGPGAASPGAASALVESPGAASPGAASALVESPSEASPGAASPGAASGPVESPSEAATGAAATVAASAAPSARPTVKKPAGRGAAVTAAAARASMEAKAPPPPAEPPPAAAPPPPKLADTAPPNPYPGP
jgi:serine/threonine-protein kinase